ncbi:MAG: helix-turn-helix domain-containing protein [Pyrinomonadaceae bacterium]
MYSEQETRSPNSGDSSSLMVGAAQNRIEALRSLATLLLREVESLKDTPIFQPLVREEDVLDLSKEVLDLSKEMERFEIHLIRNAMIRAKGNQRGAAAILGTKATTLHAKIKRLGLEDFSALGKL